MNKYKPWDIIKAGDVVYFKNSGEPVKIKAKVERVLQFHDLDPAKVKNILNKYAAADGIENSKIAGFYELFKTKKYCILVFLERAIAIEPFEIDKTGFGSMSSWIVVDNINKIKVS